MGTQLGSALRLAVVATALAVAVQVAPLATPQAPAEAAADQRGDRRAAPADVAARKTASGQRYLLGRGVADMTGEPARSNKLGYADPSSLTQGIRQRLRSRAFVVADPAASRRVVFVVADVALMFDEVREEVLRRLQERYGDLYRRDNVMITAQHTHSSPGGYGHYSMYNLAGFGFHEKTYGAVIDGIVESIVLAHRDLAPGRLGLSVAQLRNASVNRSRLAFDRNPAADRRFFPDAIDPQSTSLSFFRKRRLVGLVNWFATHGTSVSDDNVLINGDNKGYAAYHSERVERGVDYLAKKQPAFVGAFAQTNAGDMTPNLALQPGTGPTPDQYENTRLIGERQYDAAHRSLRRAAPVDGGVDHRMTYVDMGATEVRPEFTGDGRTHTTCTGALGTGFAAGSKEDGPGLAIFEEGDDTNPAFAALSDALYTASPELRECQAPKDILIATGPILATPDVLPLQLVRIGQLYLIGLPQEATIVAGLRLRRTVADIVGAPLDQVLVSGYANSYAGYVTTPEEYDQGDYEAGHTLFGRWTLPAYQQHVAGLARDMAAGRPTPITTTPPDVSATAFPAPPTSGVDTVPPGSSFGDVLAQPRRAYRSGQRVRTRFVGANPNNDLRRGSTYLVVQRRTAAGWRRVHDDNDWSTRFRWDAEGTESTITITWDVPRATERGRYRIVYRGDAQPPGGGPQEFAGTTRVFRVRR